MSKFNLNIKRLVCVRFPKDDLWLTAAEAVARRDDSLSLVDWQGFGNCPLGWDNLLELDELIEEYGLTVFAAYEYCHDYTQAREMCLNQYEGHYKTAKDWAFEWCDSNADWFLAMPSETRGFIDFEQVATCAIAGGNYSYVPGVSIIGLEDHAGVWVFRT